MASNSGDSSPLGTAVACAGIWTVIEFFARRVVERALRRVIGNDRSRDMVVLLFGASSSSWVIKRIGARTGFKRDIWDYRWTPRAVASGIVAGIAALASLTITTRIDSKLFDGMNDTSLFDEETSAIAGGLLVAVNGVVVPIAEEFAWRGIIQTALVERFGSTLGIGLTSIVFAFKHIIVDRSISRFTTLLALGSILGIVRYRLGTGASTAAHMTANLISSFAVVVQQSE